MMATTTAPTLSGQLRVSNADAQTLHNSFGVTQTKHEQYSPSFKPENYSGSFEHKHCLGSKNEKDRTANPTLWGGYFFSHQENQHLAKLQDSQPSFRGEPWLLAGTKAHPHNKPSIRGFVRHLRGTERYAQNHTGTPNYESFVVHISTYTKSVGQSSGDSLAFLRCLRLISPSSDLTMNCAVLSFSSLVCSTACATSCGTRALIFCDLLLILFGGITDLPVDLWVPVYTKYNFKKALMWVPLGVYSGCQLSVDTFNDGEALTDCTPCRASIHNVTETYTMALQHSTQTRPEKKYLWRFLALNRSDMCAKPCRISVEAPTEHDARRVLAPFFILSLSARLSAQGVCNA